MMNSPPRYTRTVPEGSFYEHHNKHIDAANVNFNFNFNGSSAPPPAYSREANQTSTATQDAQVNVAEDGSSSSSQWAALERTPSIPQQVEPTPSRPQHAEPIPSRLQQVEATPSRPQQARLSDLVQRTVKFVRVEVSERRTVPRYGHGAHGYADNNDAFDGRPVRPLRNPKYRCELDPFCLFVVLGEEELPNERPES